MNIELEVIQAIARDIQSGASVQKAYMNNYIRLRRFAVKYVTELNEPYQKSPFATDEETLDLLINDIALVFRVSINQIKKCDRQRPKVILRHLFCYIAGTHEICNLETIGHYLGYRDHTTVIHGRESFKDNLSIKEEKYLITWKRWMEEGSPMFTDLFRPAVKPEYSNHSPMGIAS